MRTVVILPTYNEASNIAPLVARLVEAVPKAHLLVVDDNSPDGTAGVVRTLQQRFPQLGLLVRQRKLGLGSAYLEVFAELAVRPGIDAICTMDADFSHDPSMLPAMIEVLADYDIVIGSRYVTGGSVEGWRTWRRALSRIGNAYARTISRSTIRDLTSGFVCFRRTTLAKLDLAKVSSSSYAYTIESKCLALAAGARVKELPISFKDRTRGRSKMDFTTIREGVFAPWRMHIR